MRPPTKRSRRSTGSPWWTRPRQRLPPSAPRSVRCSARGRVARPAWWTAQPASPSPPRGRLPPARAPRSVCPTCSTRRCGRQGPPVRSRQAPVRSTCATRGRKHRPRNAPACRRSGRMGSRRRLPPPRRAPQRNPLRTRLHAFRTVSGTRFAPKEPSGPCTPRTDGRWRPATRSSSSTTSWPRTRRKAPATRGTPPSSSRVSATVSPRRRRSSASRASSSRSCSATARTPARARPSSVRTAWSSRATGAWRRSRVPTRSAPASATAPSSSRRRPASVSIPRRCERCAGRCWCGCARRRWRHLSAPGSPRRPTAPRWRRWPRPSRHGRTRGCSPTTTSCSSVRTTRAMCSPAPTRTS